MKRAIIIILLLLAGCSNRHMPLNRMLPAEINGWRAAQKGSFYDRKTLFNYINGGAELYLAYDFQKAWVQKYTKEHEPSIEVALFSMDSPRDAYGIFTFEREDEDIGIGQGSEYAAGLLRFWKNSYFICVMAEKDTESSRKTAKALAKAIAKKIPSDAAAPDVIKLLPQQNLRSLTIRYFHNNECLNRLYYVANQNILNLSNDTEAVLARYSKDMPACHLLLIRYKTGEAASGGYQSFIDAYLPEAPEGGPYQTENERWTGALTKKEYIAIVFDAASQKEAEKLLREVSRILEAQ